MASKMGFENYVILTTLGSDPWGTTFLARETQGESRFVDVVAKLSTLHPVPAPDGRSAESWLALVHVEVARFPPDQTARDSPSSGILKRM